MKTLAIYVKENLVLKNIIYAFLMSVVIALFSRVVVPLPFTPVPVAFQNIICLMMGVFLGKRTGALAVFFFLVQGMCGLSVFSGGGSGILWLFGPTGGYLLGYLLGAYVTGSIYEKSRDLLGLTRGLAVGAFVVYLLGAARLSLLIGCKQAVLIGVVPFLLVDLLKILGCVGALSIRKKATR